ncbi:MAG: AAA family ATPase [Candidatus Heimdallarchaeum aukensis]|uniref:AAA family ATPase n=1 Tax=Candidatus Heimdallarchaeum aukensis TaxID=2876573 RepID=A0A9Y1BK86_9ARCH|nr:MAG: AAA family ATPase [Candidatus Heimdallarchaeum aukensis]
MSVLYYENLEEKLPEKVVESIMWSTLHGIKPYLEFIDRIVRSAIEERISIEIEKYDITELILEETEINKNIDKINEEVIADYKVLLKEKRLSRQLRKVIKLVEKGVGVLYRFVEPNNDMELENYDLIKERFLDADKVFPHRKLEYQHTIRVLDTYPPLDLLVLKKKDIKKSKQKMRIYQRANLYQYGVIKESLEQLLNRPLKHNRNLIRLFENVKHVRFGDVIPHKIKEDEWLFLTDKNRVGSQDQRKFVQIALGTPDLAILEGPPGSGKTTTICELIYQGLRRGLKILLVASTHVAVDNVLEKLMDENSPIYDEIKKVVLPVRIGKTDRISDLATMYQVDTYWESEKEKLKDKLRKLKNKTESQKMLLDLLDDKEKGTSDYMKRVFIKAANLVCGTTIGILRHPEIEKRKKDRKITSTKPYDLLILDEASKTTFQEFIVPALLAKKYIIVGDIRQLPPYVDEDGIISNIPSITDLESKFATLIHNLKEAQKRNLFPVKCILQISNDLKDNDLEIIEKFTINNVPFYYLKKEKKVDLYKLMGSSLLIGTKENLQKQESLLPLGINCVCEGNSSALVPLNESKTFVDFTIWKRKHNAISSLRQPINLRFYNDESLTEAIGWRLIRDFELRYVDNDRYWKQIETFIPEYWDEKRKRDFINRLFQIKRLAFPSIIELLQKGFQRSKKQKELDIGLIITDGLPKKILQERHVILKYQQRMHPEISAFPRNNFYNNEALRDLPEIEKNRVFEYPNYKNRTIWVDVRLNKEEQKEMKKNMNRNKKEAKVIIDELKDLLDWMSKNRKRDGKPWIIAILPFYKGQEKLIRKKLQSYFKSKRVRTFYCIEKNAIVELCAVDRFQGHEADIIFLSFVRNRSTGIGFLDTPNRLNVALTRAKYQLVIVGDKQYFEKFQKRSEILQKLAEETPLKAKYRI